MNRLIGTWDDSSRFIRQTLWKFVQNQKGVVFQQGALNQSHSRDHSRYWEYATALAHSPAPADKRVLDAGGANSVLTWYLGLLDAAVVSTDVMKKNVDRGNENNKKFKLDVEHVVADASKPEWQIGFDCVYCINVIEHVMEHARPNFKPGVQAYWNHTPTKKEVDAEQSFVRGLADSLISGGTLVISYDYKSFGRYKCQPKCAYMRGPEDVEKRIIEPSGLKPIGHLDFTEDLEPGGRLASTGILFLQKG